MLEYNCVAWSPHLKRDIELIEQVQRRFTKRLSGLSRYSFDERLKLLNLDSLQNRRIRFDIIMYYKIIFGLVCIDRDEFFQLCLSTTRGHPYKCISILVHAQLDPALFRTCCQFMEQLTC